MKHTIAFLIIIGLLAIVVPARALDSAVQAGQMPALTGDCTSAVGTVATACKTRQIIPLTSGSGTLAQNSTSFMLAFLPAGGTAEAASSALCPIGGTFKNLYVQSNAPAAGQTLAATWRVNNLDTAITCTITGTATTCNDTTHTATCTAGQTYTLKLVTSATSGTITSVNGGIELDNP